MGRFYCYRLPRTDFQKAEKEILSILRSYKREEQKPQAPQLLSKGEEIAYAIRKQLYDHMDGNLKDI